jgi:hypothetical protein
MRRQYFLPLIVTVPEFELTGEANGLKAEAVHMGGT